MASSAEDSRQFPRPPHEFTDGESRTVRMAAYDGEAEPLVSMYTDFDADSRSQGVPPRKEPAIREWVTDLLDEGLNVVVWHDDRLVGHAVLMPVEDESAELAIFVHPDYQSAGIGTELIKVLLGHGQEEGLEHVWLAVSQRNHVAMRVYRSVGFETRLREHVEIEMELDL
ncbi:GNAT family N-acetyltransferase [Haloarcula salinisoli]|uniref:GNAT family N-acetyltransferase n=1 Tax=Haloarcula salinisoli TaxID=2487746 RepID=A0A8J8C8U1_9EURY|nr:GNAT family N-acetyltransferase [Halomicroarcula salinisoli]MBX0304677.1 GNAT family N-acetyltransferase [Halomicroarcula salinisoli]